jgi:hypothetical protein
MRKLGKTILSLVSICASAQSASAQSSRLFIPEKLEDFFHYPKLIKQTESQFHQIIPETLEDYRNLSKTNLEKEAERADTFMRYTDAKNIASRFFDSKGQLRSPNYQPTEKELKRMRRAYLGITKRSLKETYRTSPELNDLEEKIVSLLKGFILSVKGPEANGYTGIPSLDEESRLEEIERKGKLKLIEETVSEWGRRYRAEFGGEWKYNPKGTSLKELIEGIETKASIRDFQILGQKFHKIKIETGLSRKIKAELTKLLGKEWYITSSTKYDRCPEKFDYTTLSITKEKENSILSFSIGNTKENKFQAAIRYFLRF